MTPVPCRSLGALWCGATLAALFFYPLLQALDSNIYYLFWRPRDTAEFALAFALLTTVLALAWRGLDQVACVRAKLVGVLFLVIIPVTSCTVAVARQLSLKASLMALMAQPGLPVTLLVLLALAGGGAIVWIPRLVLRVVRGALLVISPALMIVMIAFFRIAGYDSGPSASSARPSETDPGKIPSTFVFLFDEMSYRFVYSGGTVKPDLSNMRRFSERATNYMDARAPGGDTIESVPGLLAGRPFFKIETQGDGIFECLSNGTRIPLNIKGPGSVFAIAKSAGLRTEAIGFFLPYCRLLSGVADTCRSFSYYNYSNIASGFSPLNPIFTTLLLWPHQKPVGRLKVPVLNQVFREIVSEIVAAAVADLSSPPARLRFIHFPVPHRPLVFDRGGYQPGDDSMRHDALSYERQLQYTDRIVGILLDALTRAHVFESSSIVIMSDHEYRWPEMAPSEASRIPLIVKRSGQTTREEVLESVRAEQVLASVLASR